VKPSGSEAATRRVNFGNGLGVLLHELRTWQGTLGVDITRAKERGFLALAADLSALRDQVDRVQALGQDVQAAQRGDP
jgi:hypothetical protein